jgi:multidrug efflux pump
MATGNGGIARVRRLRAVPRHQPQERGSEKRAGVIESAVLRLRPILMTTGAMVLGSLPLAIATGAGAESRQQIGWVIVGGLLMGTLFTLFVVPTAYMILARKRKPHAVASSDAVPAPAE